MFCPESQNVEGLAKLLLLEKLTPPEARFEYKERHRAKQLRRRNKNNLQYIRVSISGDSPNWGQSPFRVECCEVLFVP